MLTQLTKYNTNHKQDKDKFASGKIVMKTNIIKVKELFGLENYSVIGWVICMKICKA